MLSEEQLKVQDVKNYFTKQYFNRLFITQPQVLGNDEVGNIRLRAETTSRIDKLYKPDPDSLIFGIPLKY